MNDILHVTESEPGICELRMDDPESRNRLTAALVEALLRAFDRLARDRYGANFAELGFTPGMGMTALLPLAAGDGFACEMMLTAKFYKGRELAGSRLFTHLAPAENVYARALDLARRIAVGEPSRRTTWATRTLVAAPGPKVNAMGKEEIRDVVFKHIRENVDGLEGAEIDSQKSMADYQASSLDMPPCSSANVGERRSSPPLDPRANAKFCAHWASGT